MTSGQRLDTNSQWLSQRLGELGIRVRYHTTVGDELEPNVRVFQQALDRSEVVISTGGLGPTADDLTRDALAKVLGVELALDPASLEHIQQLFARRRREMPPRNVVQAMFPRGSRPIPNPHGTAPGIALDVPRAGRPPALLFALPGVPAEMREMWEATVAPELQQRMGSQRRILRHRSIRCYGVGESELERMLPDVIRRGRTPLVGITASQATITLRITAEGPTPAACEAEMEPTVATIRQCLGDLIYGEGEDELQHAVVRQLAGRGQTLASVECGSGGLLASWLSEADPSGRVFRGGAVARTEPVMTRLAGLPDGLSIHPGEPMADLVRGLARQCQESYQTDFAIALGPFPDANPVATRPGDVYYAWAGPTGIEVRSTLYAGHPDILTSRTIKTALNGLRLTLLKT
jgi:nicotinamide-nucleotide amidase